MGSIMSQYCAALSLHPNSFEAASECVGELLEQLDGVQPDLLVVFASPHHRVAFAEVASGLKKLLNADTVVGSTAVAIAGGATEIEDGPALSVFAACWGGGRARAFSLDAFRTSEGLRIVGWPDDVPATGTLLLLTEPLSFPTDDFLAMCRACRPELKLIGGSTSVAGPDYGSAMVLDDSLQSRGAVAVLLDESVQVQTVVAQGCRPIGQPLVITRSNRNVITELAGQPPLERLRQILGALDDTDQEILRRGIQVGLVVNEHQLNFGRGDFLIRSLLGSDDPNGSITISESVQPGQTIQFHLRDGVAATEDLEALLRGSAASGVLLFTCNGRGTHLFGVPSHDSGLIQGRIGPVPLAGMFCSGEVGMISGKTFLHGHTASVALFQ